MDNPGYKDFVSLVSTDQSYLSRPALWAQREGYILVLLLLVLARNTKKQPTLHCEYLVGLRTRPKNCRPSGWWLTYPSEKYESQWDWDYPIYEMENKSHVPNHQPAILDTLLIFTFFSWFD